MIADEDIARVRETADVVGIIGEYTPLKRVGADFRGPCPFHQGKHRNFSVSPTRRVYHCFVCGEGGDVFHFLQKRLGLDWPSAVRLVAAKAGIELRESRAHREGPDPREPVWEVNAHADEYFQRILTTDPRGAAAREYLAKRQVGPDLVVRARLGFAPRDGMRAHLAGLGFGDERQVAAGLLLERDEGGAPRARFRDRLIFPILDVNGQVAGFGGRLLGPGEPKYLNTPESVAFSKGRMLYGLHWARNAIRKADRVLLVEGYFDLIRLLGAGIEEVVAPLGTALTGEQAGLITRYSKNVFVLYDADRAGQKATFRAGDELLRHGGAVRVVSLPGGEDPDSFVQAHGRDALERQVADAIDILDRKVQILQRGGWFADLHKRRQAIDHLLPTLRAATDPVTRDLYLGRAAEASGVDRAVLRAEVEKELVQASSRATRSESGATEPEGRPRLAPRPARRRAQAAGKRHAAERHLVQAMLVSRAMVERVREAIGPGQFRDEVHREIFEVLARSGPDDGVAELADALPPEAAAELERLAESSESIEDVERTVRDCVAAIALTDLEDRNREIQHLIRAAHEEEKDALIAEKQRNTEAIGRLSGRMPVT